MGVHGTLCPPAQGHHARARRARAWGHQALNTRIAPSGCRGAAKSTARSGSSCSRSWGRSAARSASEIAGDHAAQGLPDARVCVPRCLRRPRSTGVQPRPCKRYCKVRTTSCCASGAKRSSSAPNRIGSDQSRYRLQGAQAPDESVGGSQSRRRSRCIAGYHRSHARNHARLAHRDHVREAGGAGTTSSCKGGARTGPRRTTSTTCTCAPTAPASAIPLSSMVRLDRSATATQLNRFDRLRHHRERRTGAEAIRWVRQSVLPRCRQAGAAAQCQARLRR